MAQIEEARLAAQELGQQARMLMAADKMEAARELLDKALETDPTCLEVYDHLGAWYMTAGEYKHAKEQFKKALLIDKGRGESYFNLGNAELMLGELNDCVESYNRALSSGFDQAGMQYFMALAYEQMENYDLVLRHLERAIKKDPADPAFKVKKIQVLIHMGRTDEAMAQSQDLIRACPELFDGYHFRTLLFQRSGAYDAALESAREAAALFPDDVDLCLDEARCLALCGRYEEADALLERAGKMNYFEESRAEFLQMKAELQAQRGDLDGAIGTIRDLADQEGELSPEAAQLLMQLLAAARRDEELLELAQQVVDQEEGDVCYRAALFFRPAALERLGRTEEAKASYREAVIAYRTMTLARPSLADAYLYRAMAHRALGEYAKALEMTDFLLALDDEQGEPHLIRALILESMGEEEKAAEERAKGKALDADLAKLFPTEEA